MQYDQNNNSFVEINVEMAGNDGKGGNVRNERINTCDPEGQKAKKQVSKYRQKLNILRNIRRQLKFCFKKVVDECKKGFVI